MQHQLRGRLAPTPVRRCPPPEAPAGGGELQLSREVFSSGGSSNQHEGPGAGRFSITEDRVGEQSTRVGAHGAGTGVQSTGTRVQSTWVGVRSTGARVQSTAAIIFIGWLV